MKIVQETRDYKQFKVLQENRNPNESNVTKLMQSMSEKQIAAPIIVNEKLEVIDGQHRLEACRRAELPVYYLIIEGLTGDDCMVLNQNQASWSGKDYLNFFKQTGSSAAGLVLKLIEQFKVEPRTVMLAGGKNSNATNFAALGTSHNPADWYDPDTFNQEDYLEAQDHLSKAKAIHEAIASCVPVNRRATYQAAIACTRTAGCDYKRLLDVCSEHGAQFGGRDNQTEIIKAMARYYNRSRRKNFMDVIVTRSGYEVLFDADRNRWV